MDHNDGTGLLAPKQKSRSCWAAFRAAHRQARDDLKLRWGRGALWSLGVFVFGCLCYVLAYVLVLTSGFGLQSSACAPDGNFVLDPYEYKFWSSSGIFQITLGFGEFTFTAAKVIDVCWDVVVGRGGQALLALLSWRVFSAYVTTCMQTKPVTFNTFRTMFVHNEVSIYSISRLVRDFSRRRGLRAKTAMVFMISTLVFILAFPTLGSSMTGYSANVQSLVHDLDNDNYIPFKSFNYLFYVIHDGARIGRRNETAVSTKPLKSNSRSTGEPIIFGNQTADGCEGGGGGNMRLQESEACELLESVTHYLGTNDFWPFTTMKPHDVSSMFNNSISLVSPTLNITGYRYSKILDNYRSDDPQYTERLERSWITDDGQIFNITNIRANGVCQPTTTYKWGFSFIQLVVMDILLLIWMIGIFLMYLRARIRMHRDNIPGAVGEYKAVFELASTMHTELDDVEKDEGGDASKLSETQLRRRITKDLNGGSISYRSSLLVDKDSSARKAPNAPSVWNFRRWFAKERWWIGGITLAICGVPATLGTRVGVYFPLGWLFPVLFVFSMYVGRGDGSRGVLLGWQTVFWTIVSVALLMGYGMTPSNKYRSGSDLG